MKMIVAVIQPSRLEAVKQLLQQNGILGLTVSEVHGFGRQRGHTEVYRGHEYQVNLLPKVKIEIAVDDPMVEKIIELVTHAARTGPEGKIGDGKIFVIPLEEVVRIRTSEMGAAAL